MASRSILREQMSSPLRAPLTAKERIELGRKQRKQMPRVDLALWQAKRRTRSPLAIVKAAMNGRVFGLVALKYERMAASPFGFFRGAVAVMAYDLSLLGHTGIACQLCGDAHVRNLGAFAGPDGRLIFDINDFDETIRGPFEWDVRRLATSIILAGREAHASDANCREAALWCLDRYRKMILDFAKMPVLDVARYQVHRLRSMTQISQMLRKAERATPLHTLATLTVSAKRRKGRGVRNHAPRIFKSAPPLMTRVAGAAGRTILNSLNEYKKSLLPERQHFLAQYRPVDVAFKVVGIGSVGMRDYCVYMEGNGVEDPLFLQIKEEGASGYAPYLANSSRKNMRQGSKMHQGQRVAEGQRAMQLQSDPFLGWTSIEGRDFLVCQLKDHKASIEVNDLKAAALIEYAGVCGEMLARGHARSGDSCVLAGYIGTVQRFDDAIVRFGMAYADQTERDWKELVRSRKDSGKK